MIECMNEWILIECRGVDARWRYRGLKKVTRERGRE
jgi:hypothetical protein